MAALTLSGWNVDEHGCLRCRDGLPGVLVVDGGGELSSVYVYIARAMTASRSPMAVCWAGYDDDVFGELQVKS